MTAPINGPRGPVDMRDVAAIHERLDAFKASLDERASREALLHAETRAWMLRSETRTLELVARLGVEVPVERETLSPPSWLERASAWMAARPTNRALLYDRALLYGLAVAAGAVSVSWCLALMGVHP